MANWDSEVAASQYDADQALNSHISGRNREDGSIQGSIANLASATDSLDDMGEQNQAWDIFDWVDNKGYDIVGIKGSEVSNMRNSINEYVKNVQTYLNGVLKDKKNKAKDAFRGTEAEAAVKEYLDKVATYINNLLSQLNSFSDKIADVGNAWIQSQSNIAGSVNAAKNAFSEGSSYTESVQYRG